MNESKSKKAGFPGLGTIGDSIGKNTVPKAEDVPAPAEEKPEQETVQTEQQESTGHYPPHVVQAMKDAEARQAKRDKGKDSE